MNNEEDRQGLIELITDFLDKLTGGQTVDTRGHADGILESVWSAIQYLLDTFDGETRAVDLNTRFDIENFFENVFEKILGYLEDNLETILELIPDSIRAHHHCFQLKSSLHSFLSFSGVIEVELLGLRDFKNLSCFQLRTD